MQFLRHPLTILSFLLFSGLFSLSLYSSWQRNQASSGQVAELEAEIAEMQQSVASLSQQAQTASSSGEMEKIIRDQLLMQKPGEVVMQLPPLSEIEEAEVVVDDALTTREKWWQLLFN